MLIADFMLSLNGNTLPVATWILMQLIQDPPLFRRVREEAEQAFAFDKSIGRRRLSDVAKLLSMPLIQSVYSEALRMHISFTATREALEDIWIGGYRIPKGSLVQSPTQFAHYDETVWGSDGHPASEFWAERHLNTEEKEPRFSINARPTSYFPYGKMPLYLSREYNAALANLLFRWRSCDVPGTPFRQAGDYHGSRHYSCEVRH